MDRRLRDFQQVTVFVGDACVHARVASIHGDEATLVLSAPLPADAGFLPKDGQLTFDHSGHPILMKGMVDRAGADSLRFVVADGVRSSDLRRDVRLSVGVEAMVTPLAGDGRDAGETIITKSVDVSAGGCLLALGGLEGAIRVALELPGSLGTVVAAGRVVRSTGDRTAVTFTVVEAADRELLDRFVRAVREQLARRFASAA